MTFDRGPLLADRELTGAAWCAQHAALVDEWLRELFADAGPHESGIALVAVGGYGRGELCPGSDIDLLLLHDKRLEVREIAAKLWYPIWDQGLKLGHSVGTVRQTLALAAENLDTATTLLSARAIAGDGAYTEELATKALAQWQNGSRRWLKELAMRVEDRHQTSGEIAFLLEPDLKDGRGGMRDVHALRWAELARRVLFSTDEHALDTAYSVLLDVRVELQRASGRPANVLTHQDQAAVAEALGDPTREALMARIVESARAIAWMSDDTWRRVASGLRGPRGRSTGRKRPLGDGVVEQDGEVRIEMAAWDSTDPLLAMRLAVAAAEHDRPIERATLDRLRSVDSNVPAPWTNEARALLERLLLAGRPAIGVIEALDHHGIWRQILPEWDGVRSRPQHNPYHRYTVDRHLLETVVNAAVLVPMVDRPDLLVFGALLHDLGKCGEGDHTAMGVELAETIARRLGFVSDDVDRLRSLVRHHLLLSDVASRRDLDDAGTIDTVVAAVGSVSQLRLLAALTEADGKATGPTAWGSWKAELVGSLVSRVTARLCGEEPGGVPTTAWRHESELAEAAIGGPRIVVAADTVTVVTDDRPGMFSRVAGVLALRGLDVLEAAAYSTATGIAVSRFRVVDRLRDNTPWDEVIADLGRGLEGRLAIHARVAERAHAAARRRRAIPTGSATVTFDNESSNDATVIDVRAPDSVGLLYRVTRAFADLDLDIRSAKVQTLGAEVIDAFYVRHRSGAKVDDRDLWVEIERAVLHAVQEGVEPPD